MSLHELESTWYLVHMLFTGRTAVYVAMDSEMDGFLKLINSLIN